MSALRLRVDGEPEKCFEDGSDLQLGGVETPKERIGVREKRRVEEEKETCITG